MRRANLAWKKFLIDINDSDEEAYNLDDYIDVEITNNKETENILKQNNEDDENTMYLIHNEQVNSDDPNISEFLQFCIEHGLFDNTFYDTHNALSVVATKLPKTFEKLSKDGDDIKKKTFITKFKKEFGYPGDINFIYNCLDSKKKGFVTWDDFVDFFLPFIQYVTV